MPTPPIVANVSALALVVLVYVLVVSERRDAACARRAVWLVSLFPAAFVLVWGYAEATTIALAVGAFLAMRRRAWYWTAGISFLVGLGRPPGFFSREKTREQQQDLDDLREVAAEGEPVPG